MRCARCTTRPPARRRASPPRASLGDLSHKVYAPKGGDAKPDELLFLDVWVEAAGIGKFFSHPDVAAQGAQLFVHKDADRVDAGARRLQLLAARAPRQARALRRARARPDRESPETTIEIFARRRRGRQSPTRASAGILSHELFIKLGPPGEPLELLGIDVWSDFAGMTAHYADATHMAALQGAFAGQAVGEHLAAGGGRWSEW